MRLSHSGYICRLILLLALRQALFDLGYEDVYHYTSLISENPRDASLWVEAMKAKYYGIGKPYGRDEWDALLGHCMVSPVLQSCSDLGFNREC